MNFELQQIKKKYGEKMAHLCRSLFPTILEEEGTLLELLESNFSPNKFLYDDLVETDNVTEFQDYISGLVNNNDEDIIITDKTPDELLSEAGYDFYECHSEEEIQQFTKYYAHDELLCTFKQKNRLDTNFVFFAVKKNVDQIRREDFKNPEREDLYGTSVISIQFSRGKTNVLSIKNRYNHNVEHPDATFKNNLNNIIPGLKYSFEKKYGFNVRQNDGDFYLHGYVRDKSGKYYKYNYEINNVYYCPNNIIINNYELDGKYQEPDKYLLMDYFVVDLQNKKILLYDDKINDGLIEASNNIKNIEVRKIDDGEKKILFHNKDNSFFEITIDKNNIIKAYKNDNLTIVPNNFFYKNKYMESMVIQNATIIKNNFLKSNTNICYIDVNNAEIIGDHFLSNDYKLDEFIGNKVKEVGNYFLSDCDECKKVEMNELEEVGDFFLSRNDEIKSINFPKLKSVGNYFIDCDSALTEAHLPILNYLGDSFLSKAKIKNLELNNIKSVGNEFLAYDSVIEKLVMNNLEKAGHDLLYKATRLKEFLAPKLRIIGNNGLADVKIENLELNSLESVGDGLLRYSSGLVSFVANKLTTVGNYFMEETESIKRIELNELRETGHSFLRFNEVVEEVITPKLIKTGYGFIESSDKIKILDIHNLEIIGADSLKEYNVKASDLPNLTKVIGFNGTNISNNPNHKFYNIIKKNNYKKDLFKTDEIINNINHRRVS